VLGTSIRCAKMTEPTRMLLDRIQIPSGEGALLRVGMCWPIIKYKDYVVWM